MRLNTNYMEIHLSSLDCSDSASSIVLGSGWLSEAGRSQISCEITIANTETAIGSVFSYFDIKNGTKKPPSPAIVLRLAKIILEFEREKVTW